MNSRSLSGIQDADDIGQLPTDEKSRNHRRLLTRDEVLWLLHLVDDQVQFLIDTRQLTVFKIAGEERFDSSDIGRLIDSYKSTAKRRAK